MLKLASRLLLVAAITYLLCRLAYWNQPSGALEFSPTVAPATATAIATTQTTQARNGQRAVAASSSSATTRAAASAGTIDSRVAFNASAEIPRILHQTFSSEMVYENYKPLISSCLKLNPDWTYYLWRERDAEALLAVEYPEFLEHYRQYKDRLERSDSIRYIVLHRFGGIYLDMDVECRQPFYPALAGVRSFLDQERNEQSNIYWGKQFNVMNSAMGAAPGHPFFRHVINEMLSVAGPGPVLYTTGPLLLTRVYMKYSETDSRVPIQLLEPSVMSPLMDGGKNWQELCSGSIPPRYKPESQLSWKERGCQVLQSKNWRLDDTDESTVAVHRFLHLGYSFAAGERKPPFNVTKEFWPRVHFYT